MSDEIKAEVPKPETPTTATTNTALAQLTGWQRLWEDVKAHPIAIIRDTVLTIATLWVCFMPGYEGFASNMIRFIVATNAFWIIDKYIFRRVNTNEELNRGNIAVGLYVLGVLYTVASLFGG